MSLQERFSQGLQKLSQRHRSKEVLQSVKKPEWAMQPANIREVVHKNGQPTFEMCIIPTPEEGIFPVRNVFFSHETKSFTMPDEVRQRKDAIVAERQAVLDTRYTKAMTEWEQGNRQEDAPQIPSLFNGPLVRVVPEDASSIIMPDKTRGIALHFGETTYFDYVATRDLDQEKYSHEAMALPLSICGVLRGKDAHGQEYMIYSVRTTKPESYAGFFHVVGGMLARPEDTLASPMLAWQRELLEEAGIANTEVHVNGITGFVNDTYWPHPEVTHDADLTVSIEAIFDKQGVHLTPKRPTDKEVTLRAIPWTREHVRALIVGEKILGGDEDLRPWVPSGIANVLLAGRAAFGEQWYQEAVHEYEKRIQTLNQ